MDKEHKLSIIRSFPDLLTLLFLYFACAPVQTLTITRTTIGKQRIVVKVSMNSDKNTRKALQVAVSICGVESVSFVGSDKEQIAVTGEGIDSVELTTLLRKKVGYTEMLSVAWVQIEIS